MPRSRWVRRHDEVALGRLGHTWRTLGTIAGTIAGTSLRGSVSGDGAPVRYVRLVALGATADLPLIVGELRARHR